MVPPGGDLDLEKLQLRDLKDWGMEYHLQERINPFW